MRVDHARAANKADVGLIQRFRWRKPEPNADPSRSSADSHAPNVAGGDCTPEPSWTPWIAVEVA